MMENNLYLICRQVEILHQINNNQNSCNSRNHNNQNNTATQEPQQIPFDDGEQSVFDMQIGKDTTSNQQQSEQQQQQEQISKKDNISSPTVEPQLEKTFTTIPSTNITGQAEPTNTTYTANPPPTNISDTSTANPPPTNISDTSTKSSSNKYNRHIYSIPPPTMIVEILQRYKLLQR